MVNGTSIQLAEKSSEWHDSRIVHWLHFVPMNNSFVDIYVILDYFISTDTATRTEDGKEVVGGAYDQ